MNEEDEDRAETTLRCNFDWDCMNMDCKKIGLALVVILVATMLIMVCNP